MPRRKSSSAVPCDFLVSLVNRLIKQKPMFYSSNNWSSLCHMLICRKCWHWRTCGRCHQMRSSHSSMHRRSVTARVTRATWVRVHGTAGNDSELTNLISFSLIPPPVQLHHSSVFFAFYLFTLMNISALLLFWRHSYQLIEWLEVFLAYAWLAGWHYRAELFCVSHAGYFVCHSCKKAGSWNSFKENTEQILDLVTRKKR